MSELLKEIEDIRSWISSFGSDDLGGVSRLLYSESWLEVQKALKKKFEELGMEARFDEIGNLYGKIIGTDNGNETIATGSHVDTVVNGGQLDGQLGIIGGYLAIKRLLENYGKPKKNIEIISLAEEEGSRFPYVFWGSKNIFGIAEKKDVENIEDANGIRFVDAMHQCGFDFKKDNSCSIPDVKAFVELHIEQGNTLEMEGISVGVISGIVGQRRYNIKLKGEANHAGTTLMKYRKDVTQVFAKIVTESIEKAKKVGDPLVLTFGKILVKPNTVNVVPGDAMFTMDCRHTDKEVLCKFTEEIEELMKQTANESNVEIEIDRWMDEDPVPMDSNITNVIENACKKNNIDYKIMHSGAGHDSQIIAPRIPTAMIFVPSIKGISHNPAEDTKTEDLNKGIETLKASLYELAY
ncbi:allantoate amidohydrolase [Clostridium carboxidivorans P7]|uniref:Allantoate amidohydrolase n=1 Tax=Clostridium carboxidivorans P7 TaxID=536227 RepID=C6PUH3_9CLOT|nr:allantoate deiminase [Clostridium carboxidivorans]AKN32232.1 allantoate amidohydrolase [Clostridium carboxidivorans P7]EET87076.1 allantoate amidohydrolase [Clostridium carboxidivorans P7]